MRILHVLDHSVPIHSGYSYRTLEILRHQRALGWETVHLTSLKQGPVAGAVEQVEGFEFHRTMGRGGFFETHRLLNPLAVIRTLERRLTMLIEERRPDVLHAHSPCLTGIAALRAARRADIPVVYEVRALWEDAGVDHGTLTAGSLRYRASRAMETWVLTHADQVTAICEGLRGEIVGRGVPVQDVTLIPNAVDPSEFTVIDSPDIGLARDLGLENKRVIGFIGSFYAYEGLTTLIKALPLLLEDSPDVRLLLVGGGAEFDSLRREAAALGIADKVVFTGWVGHDEVHRYYSLMEILVYPRIATRLTQLITPLKPLEAMAQGRLVVASDVGGHRELIRDGETGVLFQAGDAKSLAVASLSLLRDPSRAASLREAARRFVERERYWAASVGRYAEVYRRALGAPHSAAHQTAPVGK